MIHEKTGDLLEANGVILHGVNCQGVMGSGVALSIKERWPEVFNAYREFYENKPIIGPQTLGTIQPIWVDHPHKLVVNCFTQWNYGKKGIKYASYDAIDQCMVAVVRFVSARSEPSARNINFPLIGCDRGGLHWPVVREIIDHRIPDTFTKTLWRLP